MIFQVVCQHQTFIHGQRLLLNQVTLVGAEPAHTRNTAYKYFWKDGYICYLNAWNVAGTELFGNNLSANYRPVDYNAVISGWCRNTNGQWFYPCIAVLTTSGGWEVYAINQLGGAAYTIKNSSTNQLGSFMMYVHGAWRTSSNAY